MQRLAVGLGRRTIFAPGDNAAAQVEAGGMIAGISRQIGVKAGRRLGNAAGVKEICGLAEGAVWLWRHHGGQRAR